MSHLFTEVALWSWTSQTVPQCSLLILAKQRFNGSAPPFQPPCSLLLDIFPWTSDKAWPRLYTWLPAFYVSLNPFHRDRKKSENKSIFYRCRLLDDDGRNITVSEALLVALFSGWIFPLCPYSFPSFLYCTIEYTAMQLLSNKWDRFE